MPQSTNKCGICHENEAKYKCPKCERPYCSLACYKNTEKHTHQQDEKHTHQQDEKQIPDEVTEKKPKDPLVDAHEEPTAEKSLKTPEFNQIYEGTPELKELLQYNTVKFHLAKVYKILNLTATEQESANMTADSKIQLATDYLNTLLYGGIHHNEAVEEFCQIALHKLNNINSS